jgi:hypothetical protein
MALVPAPLIRHQPLFSSSWVGTVSPPVVVELKFPTNGDVLHAVIESSLTPMDEKTVSPKAVGVMRFDTVKLLDELSDPVVPATVSSELLVARSLAS